VTSSPVFLSAGKKVFEMPKIVSADGSQSGWVKVMPSTRQVQGCFLKKIAIDEKADFGKSRSD
jgi:hypothetical protein